MNELYLEKTIFHSYNIKDKQKLSLKKIMSLTFLQNILTKFVSSLYNLSRIITLDMKDMTHLHT